MTEQFKSRYSDGESLESLMPEAFAAICEADYRVLGKRPYDVQIIAAAALHGGYLAEMNTGEGKTLSATMPLYLNALTGKSCMLVTTNEYLASRDGAEMGEVYNFMGLSCSYPDADDTKKQDDDEKRQFYSADIIYTTNGTLGFDFLFDNLVKKKEDRFLCDFHYVIIDEADSVLLDSAIMPLVISGVPRVQSNLYDVCDFFVTTLVEDIDYIEEDKAVWLTPKGVKFAESFFGISNFYGKENFEINRHVTLSLRAHKLLKNKKDYVVTDKKEVELFDGATGRLMHGVKLRGGQHQAIDEAGINAILVGDSLGMVVLGYEDTLSVTMEDMIHHSAAVSRGIKDTLLITDMPFMSYQTSVYDAVVNAGRLVKEGHAQAVKLEGGKEVCPQIKAIVDASIPVCAHLGLTPQSVNAFGGFKVQGKGEEAAQKLLDEARAVEEAGAFAVVLECVPKALAKKITESISIPTIGIGAGADCDGQVLVYQDMLAMYANMKPKFVKQFAQVGKEMNEAFTAYKKAVEEGSFPGEEHTFKMDETIIDKLY